MIPPVASSQSMQRGPQVPEGAARVDEARNALPEPVRSGRPETPTAVEAARRAATLQKLRDGRPDTVSATGSPEAEGPPPEDAPTGPPPTFDETPLQRQARVALDPPDLVADPGRDPRVQASGLNSEEVSATSSNPDQTRLPADTVRTASVALPDASVARGFAEAARLLPCCAADDR